MKRNHLRAAKRPHKTFNKEKGKWLLRVSGIALLSVVVICLVRMGASKLLDPATLPYRSVTIEGNFQHVKADTIRMTVAPYLSAGFFGVDINDIQHVLYDIPWIRSATVRRVWPDEIHITVYEQTAVAHWGVSGLVNSDDKLFFPGAPAADVASDDVLPHLDGPLASEVSVMESYRTMSAALKPYDLTIKSLTLDERRAWHLTLNNDLSLLLGRESAMDRLQRFIRFYPAVLASKTQEIKEIDLRYTNGFVVRWNLPKAKGSNSEIG